MANFFCFFLCVCVVLQIGTACDTIYKNIRGKCVFKNECVTYINLVQMLKRENKTLASKAALMAVRKAACGIKGSQVVKVCCPLPETIIPKNELRDLVPSLPDAPTCGASNFTLRRIVGGDNATLGDVPWIALLGYKFTSGIQWLCSGSLITSRHVLTAAHCIDEQEEKLYVVRLGELDLVREDEGATPIDVLIKRTIKHEQYNSTALTNDVGILVLDKEVQFTDLIRPICIPKDSKLRAMSFENYNPFIAGWGDTTYGGVSAMQLQIVQLPVVSNKFCSQAYVQFKDQIIDERVLCAGFKSGGKDACQGDSGGPLMQPVFSKIDSVTHFYLIGVVSFGNRCGAPDYPGVYSRVTHFVPWIEKHVTGHSSL